MAQPDWPAIKAADSSVPAMWAACVPAGAAVLTLIAAVFAAIFAKRAALATEGQLRLAQPSPVLLLTVRYAASYSNKLTIEVLNCGSDLAFDVELQPLRFTYQVPGEFLADMSFRPVVIVRAGESPAILHNPVAAIADPPSHWKSQGYTMEDMFMQKLIDEGQRRVGAETQFVIARLLLKWKSAKGKQFSQDYELISTLPHEISSRPIRSLVRDEEK